MALRSIASALDTPENRACEKAHHLVITGYCRERRHAVVVDGTDVWLSGTCFLAIVDLVLAILTTYSGYTPVPSCALDPDGKRVVIHRLRKNLRKVLRDTELITCDGKTRYRLNIAPSCLTVEQSFFELPVPSFVSPDTMSALRFETQKKPD